MSQLPRVILLGKPITTPYKDKFLKKFVLLEHLSKSREEFIEKSRPGGAYHDAIAIVRNFQPATKVGLIDPALLDEFPPNVKVFASTGAGHNNVDLSAFTKRGIYYTNT